MTNRSLTTLELATEIARAIRYKPHLADDLAAVEVLKTLHRFDSWFCRMQPDGAGNWDGERIEYYEQHNLFGGLKNENNDRS